MVAVAEKRAPNIKGLTQEKKISTKKGKKEEIPAYLIYEWLDGAPVYYRGYRQVLDKTKTFEEIMAYGDLQAIFLTFIKDYFQPIFGKPFLIIQGETGVHLELGTNPSLDLCFFPRKGLTLKKAANKYFDKPPTVVIEVDTKSDAYAFEEQDKGNYYILKTKRLLEFGVKEVVWIFTSAEKVTVARQNQPWLTVDYTDEIEILGHRCSIQQIIETSEKEQS